MSISGLPRSSPASRSTLRSVSRDCLEVAKSIGIVDPAEAAEKEALFRRAVALRKGLVDRSFEGKAELAEALAYLGHLLNATNRRGEGEQVMAQGRALLASLESESPGHPARRHRVVSLEDLFTMPRYCEHSPGPDETLAAHQASLDGKARLVAEFPFLPEFRASLAWSLHAQAATLTKFGRGPRRRPTSGGPSRCSRSCCAIIRPWTTTAAGPPWRSRAWAVMLEGSDRLDEARSYFRRAIAILPEAHRMRARIAGSSRRPPAIASDQLCSKRHNS